MNVELGAQPARLTKAWGARVSWGLDAGMPLLLAGHLSLIVLAVQGRASFAAIAGSGGEHLQISAGVLAFLLLVRWFVRAAVCGERSLRAVQPWVALCWTAHALGLGTGAGLLAAPDFDGWCALLSSTWSVIPGPALAHLVALALTAIDTKQSLLRLVPTGRFSAADGPWPPRVAWLVAAAIALWGSSGVFALATGSGAIF